MSEMDEKDLLETIDEEEVLEEVHEQVHEEYTADEVKRVKRKLIFLLLAFTLSTIIYIVCKALDPFKNIDTSNELELFQIMNYIKYVMILSGIISIIGIIITVLYFLNIRFKIKKKVLGIIIEVLDWVVIFPICITIASFCFSFVFTLTIVNGDSMNPNLYNGEELFLLYTKKLNRFDVVVIDVDNKYQTFNEELYVKRIIGMPGEYLEYKREINEDGNLVTNLYVNGTYIDEYFYNDFEKEIYLTYSQTFNEFNFEQICSINDHDNTLVNGRVVIPDGYYLVLGDNRINSKDSRSIGLICEDDIIGKIKFRIKSLFDFEKIE